MTFLQITRDNLVSNFLYRLLSCNYIIQYSVKSFIFPICSRNRLIDRNGTDAIFVEARIRIHWLPCCSLSVHAGTNVHMRTRSRSWSNSLDRYSLACPSHARLCDECAKGPQVCCRASFTASFAGRQLRSRSSDLLYRQPVSPPPNLDHLVILLRNNEFENIVVRDPVARVAGIGVDL